jgi:hypothetical protein
MIVGSHVSGRGVLVIILGAIDERDELLCQIDTHLHRLLLDESLNSGGLCSRLFDIFTWKYRSDKLRSPTL